LAEEIGRLPGASPAKGLGRINAASQMAGTFFNKKIFQKLKFNLQFGNQVFILCT
jgi:hypothetical protein